MEDINKEIWKPSISPWIMIIPVMMAVFMFVLDETISNVALTYIAGSMSVSQSESTWVVTSYLIASGIVIPTVEFFSKLMGRKHYFMLCIAIFSISSFMCAISQNMPMIVIMRFIQGLGGGSLLPIGQTIMLESFPPEKRSQSMALFGLVIVFAPIIGPIIGGWVTENWSWPWIYLINVPIGIVCIYLIHTLLEVPPYAEKQKDVQFDYIGLFFLSFWLIFLQIVLDKGNDADWFSARWVCWMTFVSCVSGILFFISQLKVKNPLMDLSVFKDRNFLFSTISQVVMMGVFLSSATILPSMLQALLGYTSYLSGLSMGSRGVGSVVCITIYSIIERFKIFNDKQFSVIGICFLIVGGLFFGMINLNINLEVIAIPNALFGAGVCLAITTLTTLSYTTLDVKKITNATGTQNLLKNIGGAIGTSFATTMISRGAQKHQMMMVGNLSDLNQNFTDRINAMAESFGQVDINQGITMAKATLYNQLNMQSHLWAYIDTFRTFAIACLLIIPFILLIKSPPKKEMAKK